MLGWGRQRCASTRTFSGSNAKKRGYFTTKQALRGVFNYGRVLIPASLQPIPTNLSASQAHDLLRESGASLVRWFSRTCAQPTRHWYVICGRYDFEALSHKVRNQIRKAHRECELRHVDAEWMAVNAYDCYAAAFGRYKHGRPIAREDFAQLHRACAGGPFSFLGAFVDGKLAAFAKCAIMNGYVALSTFRLDPAYAKSLATYAMLDNLLRAHVTEAGRTLGNGFQSLHDTTNMQDFLLKFGFRRVYCDLQIAYKRPLGSAIGALYPFRKLIGRLPARPPIPAVKSLLLQEEVRRATSSFYDAPAPESIPARGQSLP